MTGSRRLDLDAEEIVRRFVAGESVFALAQHYHAGLQTIRRRIREAGVPLRNCSEAGLVRTAQLSAEERVTPTEAAARARRARPSSEHALHRQAVARQRRWDERALSDAGHIIVRMLKSRGYMVDCFTPVDRYNLDITVGAVAIEVLTNARCASSKREGQRLRRIMEHGYSVIFVHVDGRTVVPLYPKALQSIASFVAIRRRFPTQTNIFQVIHHNGAIFSFGTINEATFEQVPYQ
jgi:hypothetical protein